MKYRSLATVVIALLVLCASAAVSCNDAAQEEATQAPAAQAARPDASAPAESGMPAEAAQAGAESESEPAAEEPAEEPAKTAFVTGEGVYKAANCAMCHGEELEGSRLAPALKGIAQYWDAESLAEYLVDPVAYAEDDVRLKTNKLQYKLPMPAWKQTGIGEADMMLLIEWLLEQETE